jgi:hypothetical protein
MLSARTIYNYSFGQTGTNPSGELQGHLEREKRKCPELIYNFAMNKAVCIALMQRPGLCFPSQKKLNQHTSVNSSAVQYSILSMN